MTPSLLRRLVTLRKTLTDTDGRVACRLLVRAVTSVPVDEVSATIADVAAEHELTQSAAAAVLQRLKSAGILVPVGRARYKVVVS